MLLPKLKMFIWRCYWNAVPVQAVLSSSIRTLPQDCKLCGAQREMVMHTLFHCQFARTAWLDSPMCLRTNWLTGTFKETVIAVKKNLTDKDFASFISMALVVCRSRNDAVYGAKIPNNETCLQYFRKTDQDAALLQECTGTPESGSRTMFSAQRAQVFDTKS